MFLSCSCKYLGANNQGAAMETSGTFAGSGFILFQELPLPPLSEQPRRGCL